MLDTVVLLPPNNAKVPLLEPIPETLKMAAAVQSRDRRLVVGIALYLEIERWDALVFPFNNDAGRQLGLTPRKKREGLKELERAGIVRVIHRDGCCPVVVIEEPRWFDAIPAYVGQQSLQLLANSSAEGGDDSPTIEAHPPESFAPVTIKDLVRGYEQYRKRFAIRGRIPVWPHKDLWRIALDCFLDVCGHKPTFSLSPGDLRSTFEAILDKVPDDNRAELAALELHDVIAWLSQDLLFTDNQLVRLDTCFDEFVRARRRPAAAAADEYATCG